MTAPIEKWAKFVWPTDEVWRAVVGFPGYEVSDQGRVRSLRRTNPRLMTPEIDEDGYSRLALVRDGRYVHQLVHRMVAMAFNGPAPEGMPICRHGDNNAANNRPSNLVWGTQADNMADKNLHGTAQIGSKHPMAVITEEIAVQVKARLQPGKQPRGRLRQISRELGVSYNVVADISRGRTWGHAC